MIKFKFYDLIRFIYGGNYSVRDKVGIFLICMIFFISSLISIYHIETVSAGGDKLYVGGNGPGNYTTIQIALNNAKSDDTIFVYNGIYSVNEGISIKQPLNLIGENKNNTIIKGNERGDPLRIESSNVNIKNFTIKYSKRYDASKTYAAIRIVGDFENITISNNILTENSQGIVLWGTSYVNIYNNEIYNNDYDGIVLQSSNYNYIENNTIYYNGYNYLLDFGPDGDGLDLRYSNNNKIINNTISNNKVDGIWLDGVVCVCNNLFLNNKILGNQQYGIHFGGSNPSNSIIKNNTFSYNLIKNNSKGGISLRYAKENYFFENNIEGNGDFGIKILYIDKEEFICENNMIYHNNFINNGEYGLLKEYIPKYKKFCNAADSNNGISSSYKSYNQWDNGIIDDKIYFNNSSEKGGNYWCDYEECYNKVFADSYCGYHGIWMSKYGMKIQLHLYIEKFLDKTINLDFLESKVYDSYPWCRMNGWNPQVPDKPLLKTIKDNINFFKYYIMCLTNDANNDKITYSFNIIDNETNETITGGWQVINAEPVNSSATATQIWSFEDYGSYTVYVKAIDVRDGNDYHGNGFDGQSEIAKTYINIK